MDCRDLKGLPRAHLGWRLRTAQEPFGEQAGDIGALDAGGRVPDGAQVRRDGQAVPGTGVQHHEGENGRP